MANADGELPDCYPSRAIPRMLGCDPTTLPRGVIVGTAVISHCDFGPPFKLGDPVIIYNWHLTDVQRLEKPLKPTRRPQPVWFNPFDGPREVTSSFVRVPAKAPDGPLIVRVTFVDSTSKSAEAYGGAVVWITGVNGDVWKSGDQHEFEHTESGSRWRRTNIARVEPAIPNGQKTGFQRISGKAELTRGMELVGIAEG